MINKNFIHSINYNEINEILSHNPKLNNDNNISKDIKQKFKEANIELDKYYTKEEVAKLCYDEFKKLLLINYNQKLNTLFFIEPSAGSGVFLEQIEEEKIGFDIAPTKESKFNIIKLDFLKEDFKVHLNEKQKKKTHIIIGNPPFGIKSKLAIDFLNKALETSKFVGFIVPIQFRKWSVQSKINAEAKLILDIDLIENAFEFMGKDYKIRCCFQIWCNDYTNNSYINKRIISKPVTTHEDFEMYQFNRTKEAEKYFDYEWDFAVVRQGYDNYNFKAFKKEECNRKKQWIFFKAKNNTILKNLLKIDFAKLSTKNLTIPGFGKADVILEYTQIIQSKS